MNNANDLFEVKEVKDEYFPLTPASNSHWWCNVHNREATHIFIKTINGKVNRKEVCCDPKLGGILIPCNVAYKRIKN